MFQSMEKGITRALRLALGGGVLAGCLVFGSAAHAGIVLQFDYGIDNGTGFWDPVDGATRRNAMTDAATAFESMFASHFTNSATILLSATATNDPNSSTLASAYSEYADGGTAGFTALDVVRVKATTGTDLNGAAADGGVDVNFGQAWYFGSGQTPNDKFDFYSTVFHEFSHALGFASTISQDGSGLFTGQNKWGAFDQFLVDKNGNRVIDPGTFELNQTVWNTASVGDTDPGTNHVDGMYFDGANAVAAYGSLVPLFSPNPWNGGSSVSHLDDETFASTPMMMLAAGPTGPWPRDYNAIEVGIMADLGYTLAPVPEPDTYAMLLAGLGLMGWITRRRFGA